MAGLVGDILASEGVREREEKGCLAMMAECFANQWIILSQV